MLDLLTNGTPHREVYAGRDGGWWVTHGGGEVTSHAVSELVSSGAVVSVYSDCPKDAYHVGRTLDTVRTLAARMNCHRKADSPKIYVGDQTHPKEHSLSESEKR